MLDIPGFWKIEASILDVSNPMVLVRAEDIGMKETELPEAVNQNKEVCDLLEKIAVRGLHDGLCQRFCRTPPRTARRCRRWVFTAPVAFTDIAGEQVSAGDMDLCARVISVFKCHKACPLTSASSISVAAPGGNDHSEDPGKARK